MAVTAFRVELVFIYSDPRPGSAWALPITSILRIVSGLRPHSPILLP